MTRLRLSCALATLVLLVSTASCLFDPKLGEGQLTCGAGDACPAGYTCGSDNKCYAKTVNGGDTNGDHDPGDGGGDSAGDDNGDTPGDGAVGNISVDTEYAQFWVNGGEHVANVVLSIDSGTAPFTLECLPGWLTCTAPVAEVAAGTPVTITVTLDANSATDGFRVAQLDINAPLTAQTTLSVPVYFTRGLDHYPVGRLASAPTAANTCDAVADAPVIPLSVPDGGTAELRAMWDGASLFVCVEVADTNVFTGSNPRDGDLWEDDSIELGFDPDENRGELIGARDFKFMLAADGTEHDAEGLNSGFDTAFDSLATVDGDINSGTDNDTGYTLVLIIPVDSPSPPANFDTWVFDAKLNDRDAVGAAGTEGQGWSSGATDFNVPNAWGVIHFTDIAW